jgi:DNA-binding LacI/PurR family transcriptional regulator
VTSGRFSPLLTAMFTSSSRYATLTQQVVRQLEEDIRHGILRESLPAERELAARMEVSRRTIRAAVQILRDRHLIRTAHGAPTRILGAPVAPVRRVELRAIGLLLPKPLEMLKPFTAVVDILRGLFHQNGRRLDVHFGARYLSPRPAAALRRLVAQSSCDGWILASATHACQSWFQSQGLVAVVAGTAHAGVALPAVDVDMLATSRHAANVLMRRGHRRLALLLERADWAGFRLTEHGFLEGVRQFGDNAVGLVCRHNGDVADLQRVISRLLRPPAPPTALFIVNPFHYLAVAAILAEQGLKVPRDISLLCRDDDACLRFLPVAPSRYSCSAQAQAKQLFATLMTDIQSRPKRPSPRPLLLMPEYIAGASVGAPR